MKVWHLKKFLKKNFIMSGRIYLETMIVFYYIFLFIFITFGGQTDTLQKVQEISLPLVNPHNIIVNEGRILIYDAGADQPFLLYETESGNLVRFGSRGRGPGEINARDSEISMALAGDIIYIFKEGRFGIHQYTTDGRYKNTIGTDQLRGMMNYVTGGGYIYNFTTSVLNDEFVRIFRIEDGGITYLSQIELQRDKFHSLYYNSMIKQGSFAYGSENELYFGLLYSSMLFSSMPDGTVRFITFEPYLAELPPAEGRRNVGGGIEMRSPDAADHPFQYKGLAVNRSFLFGLYSGQQLSRRDLIRNYLGSNIRIGEGKKLTVFDNQTGLYLKTFELDDWVFDIAADETYIYALNISDDPKIVVYAIPEIVQ